MGTNNFLQFGSTILFGVSMSTKGWVDQTFNEFQQIYKNEKIKKVFFVIVLFKKITEWE